MTTSDSNPGLSRRLSDPAPTSQLGELSGLNVREADAVHVLFIDESVSARESASAYLRDAGYAVTVAANGFDALADVVKSVPDVVLTDIMIPRLDGYQLCAIIKSNSDYQHIPVIMLNGRGGVLDEARARLVGCNGHVSKPFTAQALLAAVSEAGDSTREGEE